MTRASNPERAKLVLDKSYNSAFLETELEDWCGEQGITQLIVAGMMTELCVDATIQSAFERGYQVLVPQGCCATYDNEYLTAEQAEAYYEQKIWQEDMHRSFRWMICSLKRPDNKKAKKRM